MLKFIKKNKNIVYDKWFLFIFSTLVIFFGIGNELFKGTNADSLPVNDAFDDMSFYMCVMDAYNSKNNTKNEYTYNLSDTELASITKLDCSEIGNEIDDVKKIKSAKGIEKLTSLVELVLEDHEITSIDISNNTLLEKVSLDHNKLVDIDVTANSNLLVLVVSNNKLSSIDVSKNVNLEDLVLSNNQLVSIDVTNNTSLKGLLVDSNKLVELNLINNNELEFVYSFYNDFSKVINLYKNESLKLDIDVDGITFPSEMSRDLFSWIVYNKNDLDVISFNDSGIITGLNGGITSILGGVNHKDITNLEGDISYFLVDYIINVIDISSEKYKVDKLNKFVYIGNDIFNDDYIDIVGLDYNRLGDKLQILGVDDNLITEFDILGIDFFNMNVVDNNIRIINEISYDEFISHIIKSEKISYKIFSSNNDLINNGLIDSGSRLDVYYEDVLLDTYNIKIENNGNVDNNLVAFDNTIIFDEKNNYIKYKKFNSTIEEFLTNVIIASGVRVFISDVNGNEKNNDDLVVTGDILTVFVGSEKKLEYSIAVRGDTNGDGNILLSDLTQLRIHIINTFNSIGDMGVKTGIYLYALDMNEDGKVSLTDLVRVRKVLAGISIDE